MSLDDLKSYQRLDGSGMGALIAGLAAQCRDAWRQALDFPLPESFRSAERIVVLGMGGSAIGADLAAGLQAAEGGAPLIVSREHTLPSLAGERALVIASSRSGDTEETLSAFRDALERRCMAMGLTAGGALARTCQERGVPCYRFEWPGPPRAAIGYGLFPLLAWLQRLGLGPDRTRHAEEAIAALERLARTLHPSEPAERNPAKRLAQRIGSRILVVYGAQHLAAVARRWKSQVNENAKSWAFFDTLPELGHNSIEGFGLPASARDQLSVALLRAPSYDPPIARRLALVAEALDRAGVPHEIVEAPGDSLLAQVMTGVLLGDYASYYLAIQRGVDPTPVPAITWLKGRISQA